MTKLQIFVNIGFFSGVMFSIPRFLGFSPNSFSGVFSHQKFMCPMASSLMKLFSHSFQKVKGKRAPKF